MKNKEQNILEKYYSDPFWSVFKFYGPKHKEIEARANQINKKGVKYHIKWFCI